MNVQKKSELVIVTRAKDLSAYVMTVTQKSPKQFRFTYVSRMQNLSINIIEHVYRANDVFIIESEKKERYEKRLTYQHSALTDLRILSHLAVVSLEQGCILPKHFKQIAVQGEECQRLLGAWINSDKRRFRQ